MKIIVLSLLFCIFIMQNGYNQSQTVDTSESVIPYTSCDSALQYIYSSACIRSSIWLPSQTNKAKRIFNRRLDINCQSFGGETALMVAADIGNISMVKWLLAKGADINIKDTSGETALMNAGGIYPQILEPSLTMKPKYHPWDYKYKDSILCLLIQKGANVNDKNNSGTTCLMCAALIGRRHAIEILLKNKADINQRDLLGNTALIYAVQNNKPDIVIMLLKAGADKNIKNNENKTALDIAREQEYSLYTDEKSNIKIHSLLIRLLE